MHAGKLIVHDKHPKSDRLLGCLSLAGKHLFCKAIHIYSIFIAGDYDNLPISLFIAVFVSKIRNHSMRAVGVSFL